MPIFSPCIQHRARKCSAVNAGASLIYREKKKEKKKQKACSVALILSCFDGKSCNFTWLEFESCRRQPILKPFYRQALLQKKQTLNLAKKFNFPGASCAQCVRSPCFEVEASSKAPSSHWISEVSVWDLLAARQQKGKCAGAIWKNIIHNMVTIWIQNAASG